MKYIKIYGAPRSGTNHLKYVLENNFKNIKVFMDVMGMRTWPYRENVDWTGRDWTVRRKKAERTATINKLLDLVDDNLVKANKEKKIFYAITTRHPCASYLSRLRKRFNGEELNNALKQTVGVFWYTLYWNSVHWNWVEQFMYDPIRHDRSIFIKHENLVKNFYVTMDMIKNAFGLERNLDEYVNTFLKLHPSGSDYDLKPLTEKNNYDPNYDDKGFYMRKFSQEVINEFKRYLNDELMDILDYNLEYLDPRFVSPEDLP